MRSSPITLLFGKSEPKINWKSEYDNGIYKIYDWNKQLAGYFFPEYGQIEPENERDDAIEQMNKSHSTLNGGHLLIPMLKLGLLDSESALSIENVISSLESNHRRAMDWREWLEKHAKEFSILGVGVHTAREDRNMLSIVLALVGSLVLGDKQVIQFLTPVLNQLHSDSLL